DYCNYPVTQSGLDKKEERESIPRQTAHYTLVCQWARQKITKCNFLSQKRDESNGEFLSSRSIDRKVQCRSTLKTLLFISR
ncbi:MAG: hypothetical protein ACKPKF_20720, partial [Microcystis panniformis]